MQTVVTVQCPLPGLEAVEVDFDMMASEADTNAWGESGAIRHNEKVIRTVRNFPEEYGEPFGPDSPVAFRIWCVRKGYRQAVRTFVDDPN